MKMTQNDYNQADGKPSTIHKQKEIKIHVNFRQVKIYGKKKLNFILTKSAIMFQAIKHQNIKQKTIRTQEFH